MLVVELIHRPSSDSDPSYDRQPSPSSTRPSGPGCGRGRIGMAISSRPGALEARSSSGELRGGERERESERRPSHTEPDWEHHRRAVPVPVRARPGRPLTLWRSVRCSAPLARVQPKSVTMPAGERPCDRAPRKARLALPSPNPTQPRLRLAPCKLYQRREDRTGPEGSLTTSSACLDAVVARRVPFRGHDGQDEWGFTSPVKAAKAGGRNPSCHERSCCPESASGPPQACIELAGWPGSLPIKQKCLVRRLISPDRGLSSCRCSNKATMQAPARPSVDSPSGIHSGDHGTSSVAASLCDCIPSRMVKKAAGRLAYVANG